MSFYSYKNANPCCCPGTITNGSALDGLQEKVCVQVKRVYDSCLQQEQLDDKEVTITSYAMVANNCCSCNCCCDDNTETVPPTSPPVPPITFESCRSTTTEGTIRNLSVERLCDRPCFARVRCKIDVPIDILFVDSRCVEYIGKGVITVDKDVLLSIPDESIVPYCLESMVSAICVAGTYEGNNKFKLTVCVTVILKVLAQVEDHDGEPLLISFPSPNAITARLGTPLTVQGLTAIPWEHNGRHGVAFTASSVAPLDMRKAAE